MPLMLFNEAISTEAVTFQNFHLNKAVRYHTY